MVFLVNVPIKYAPYCTGGGEGKTPEIAACVQKIAEKAKPPNISRSEI